MLGATSIHTHGVVLGGQYGSTNQIIGLKRGATVPQSIHSQLQLLADRESSQLLAKVTVTWGVKTTTV